MDRWDEHETRVRREIDSWPREENISAFCPCVCVCVLYFFCFCFLRPFSTHYALMFVFAVVDLTAFNNPRNDFRRETFFKEYSPKLTPPPPSTVHRSRLRRDNQKERMRKKNTKNTNVFPYALLIFFGNLTRATSPLGLCLANRLLLFRFAPSGIFAP